MKKYLFILLSLATLFAFAQKPLSDNIDGKCSHQHHFENSFKNATDVSYVADFYDMHFVHLNLKVESTSTYVEGWARMDATVSTPDFDTIYLELNQSLTLDSMKLNGEIVEPTFNNSELFVAAELEVGEIFTLETYYHGSSSSGGFFSGITTDYNNTYQKDVTWTLSEPFSARDWWPVRQNLNDKIDSVFQDYTCPDSEMAGSNGLLTETTDNGDGTKTYKWKTYYPISFYLISFAVSEYQDYSLYAHPEQLDGDSVLIQNFIYDHPNCLPNYQYNIDQSDELMELMSNMYGLYPFHEEKYGNCLAEIGGGMEHQTMSTMGSFNFLLNAHEMGHQWFGDNVTCATWSDIWINEGFASYTEYLSAQNLQSQNLANIWMNSAHNYIKSEPGGSVYVPEDEIYYGNEWRIFSGRLTYDKGAAILHMLRYLIDDDDLFFGAMQNYNQEFSDSIATGDDFKNSVAAYTGIDLDSFFEQWYYGEGYPTYSVEYFVNETGLALTITQTTSTMVTPFFDLPLEISLNLGFGNDTTFRVDITDNLTMVQTEITDEFIAMEIDPDNWIINSVGSITVGTPEPAKDLNIAVGPNPVQDFLQIRFNENTFDLVDFVVLDLSGKEVFAGKVTGSSSIDLSTLESGAYLIQFYSKDTKFSKKILKL
jgi:aminopeptidase N